MMMRPRSGCVGDEFWAGETSCRDLSGAGRSLADSPRLSCPLLLRAEKLWHFRLFGCGRGGSPAEAGWEQCVAAAKTLDVGESRVRSGAVGFQGSGQGVKVAVARNGGSTVMALDFNQGS